MLNEALRRELLAMREEDRRVRTELANAGELGGPYVPRMEDVHIRNGRVCALSFRSMAGPLRTSWVKTAARLRGSLRSMRSENPNSSEWLSPYCRSPLP